MLPITRNTILCVICSLITALAVTPRNLPFLPFLPHKPGQERNPAMQTPVNSVGGIKGLGKLAAGGVFDVISGTVYNTDGITPLLGGTVYVLDTFGFQVSTGNVSNGSYSAPIRYAGSYLLYASLSYEQYDKTYLGNTSDRKTATWVRAGGGVSVSGKNIVMQQTPLSGYQKYVITGTVRSAASNSPVGSGSLSFEAGTDSTSTKMFYTNITYDGTYSCTLTIASTGRKYISAKLDTYSYPDVAYAPIWIDGTSVLNDPKPVTLGGTTTFNLSFPLGGSISGTVMAAVVDSIESYLDISAIDPNGYEIAYDYLYSSSSKTIQNNHVVYSFSIDGLPAGSYRLYTSGSNHASQYYNGTSDFATAQTIPVTAGDTTKGITFVLRKSSTGTTSGPTGKIYGIITDENGDTVQDPYVAPYGKSSSIQMMSYTSDDRYSCTVSADTGYRIRASSLNGNPASYYSAQTWYKNAPDFASATSVTVPANDSININIQLRVGGSIGAWASDQNGNQLDISNSYYNYSDLIVYAYNATCIPLHSGFVNELGGIRIPGMNAGTYKLRVISYPFFTSATSAYGFTISPDPITVTPGITTVVPTPIRINRSTGSISGRMMGKEQWGYSLCYANDSILAGISPGERYNQTNTTDPKSKFFNKSTSTDISSDSPYSFYKLPAGSYWVATIMFDSTKTTVYSPSYYLQFFGSIAKVPFEMYNEAGFFKPQIPPDAKPITLADGQSVSGIDIGTVGVITPPNALATTGRKLSLRFSPSAKTLSISYAFGTTPISGTVKMEILSLDGRIIHTASSLKSSGTMAIRTEKLGAGIRLCRMRMGGQVMVMPVTVMGK